jgi:hypothetical protein
MAIGAGRSQAALVQLECIWVLRLRVRCAGCSEHHRKCCRTTRDRPLERAEIKSLSVDCFHVFSKKLNSCADLHIVITGL